ncbi:FG-GAP-like repeat-containing protein [Mucilaginibacter aquariorum]|uniref:FG-GAP-like repeat-containing protein n=1 Tax=Mucilaginibacter aquariorum TaxID=2967225 RepID=A0ABT1T7X5_9SPHI|nr:FG-GAP-like repeat-containing protein [Mucilaginibacter aquariorum]MCQ6960735.1 FG-GAP-like repeat-containing protein [Mucilaginibacter aquariorum]
MKLKIIILTLVVFAALGFTLAINRQSSSHKDMIAILKAINQKNTNMQNPFNAEPKIAYLDSFVKANPSSQDRDLLSIKGSLLLEVGKEQEAVKQFEKIMNEIDFMTTDEVLDKAAIAYMRLGERSNCMLNHTSSSCIFPIKDDGVHMIKTGSSKAIEAYKTLLKINPDDLESRWLINIAYMTLGQYPQNVPAEVLLPGLNETNVTDVKPFKDVAKSLGLNVNGRAGGVVVDDFNNDGYLDIITSAWDLSDPMHFFENNRNGTFSDVTGRSNLTGIKGGLNIQQTDYNNDGNIDLFVLRGAWLDKGFGDQPSSLLRNNGDGTFRDVTKESGLLYFHPTQAATWADFNNDGWLDVFIGTESSNGNINTSPSYCMLYLNNHNGTFTDVAKAAHCDISAFVKGITSADYDNDGWMDVFISTMNGKKYLLKNKGKKGTAIDFEDVTELAGIATNTERTFTTWFYDYNNDGWQDIVVCDYKFEHALSYYTAAEALGKPVPDAGNVFLYRNDHNGKFTNVTREAGLDKVVYSMGGNFGDIDNDGYLDMYFGTGNPDFKSLVPNKFFKNIEGKRFEDITTASRMGNLQKGHGVAFADLRNNGRQDIFIEMGGAYIGDSYTSSLYLNPNNNNNNWISLKLEGVKANKAAIGSHIKLTFTENGVKRSVYKDVNSGGSFGSSPLKQEMGIGKATVIDEIEIKWAGSNAVQRFRNVLPNRFLQITEGNNNYKVNKLAKLTFIDKQDPLCIPMAANLK